MISLVLLSVCSICNVSHTFCMDANMVAEKQEAATMLLPAKWLLGRLLHVYSTRLQAHVFTYGITCSKGYIGACCVCSPEACKDMCSPKARKMMTVRKHSIYYKPAVMLRLPQTFFSNQYFTMFAKYSTMDCGMIKPCTCAQTESMDCNMNEIGRQKGINKTCNTHHYVLG